jgi:hypothetical protein
VLSSRYQVLSTEYRVLSTEFWASKIEFHITDIEFRVPGNKYQVLGQTLQSLLLQNLLIGCVHWPAKPGIQDTGWFMQALYRPVYASAV